MTSHDEREKRIAELLGDPWPPVGDVRPGDFTPSDDAPPAWRHNPRITIAEHNDEAREWRQGQYDPED